MVCPGQAASEVCNFMGESLTMAETVTRPSQQSHYTDILGAVALLIAFTAIVGWVFDIGLLKSVLPGSVTMKFNTALALLLTSMALLGAARSAHRGWRRISRNSVLLVALISGLTLLEYLFDLELGIDTLLMDDDPGAIATSHPGRMAPQTAATRPCCRWTTICRCRRRARWCARSCRFVKPRTWCAA